MGSDRRFTMTIREEPVISWRRILVSRVFSMLTSMGRSLQKSHRHSFKGVLVVVVEWFSLSGLDEGWTARRFEAVDRRAR